MVLALALLHSSELHWFSALISVDFQSFGGCSTRKWVLSLGGAGFPWPESTPLEYSWLPQVPALSLNKAEAARSLQHWSLGKINQKVLKYHQIRCGKVLSSHQILPVLWMTVIQAQGLACSISLILEVRLDVDCWSQLLLRAHALIFQHSRGNWYALRWHLNGRGDRHLMHQFSSSSG